MFILVSLASPECPNLNLVCSGVFSFSSISPHYHKMVGLRKRNRKAVRSLVLHLTFDVPRVTEGVISKDVGGAVETIVCPTNSKQMTIN